MSSTHRKGSASAALEPLEPRKLLSGTTDLAYVGLTYTEAGEYQPFVQELTWGEDRRVGGVLLTPGSGEPTVALADEFSLIAAPDGAMRVLDDQDVWDPAALTGTRFDTDGYPVGWVHDQGAGEFGAVVERAPDATSEDLVGNWVIQFTQVIGSQVYTRAGSVSITSSGGFFALSQGSPGDPIYAGEAFEFVGEPVDGRFEIRLVNGDAAFIYASADANSIAFADLDTTGQDTWVGYGQRGGTEIGEADLVGSYRAGVVFESERISDALDGQLSASWRIDLNEDGTFQVRDIALVDTGQSSDPVFEGVWTSQGGSVSLTDSDRATTIQFSIGANGVTGLVTGLQTGELIAPERSLGVIAKLAADQPVEIDASAFAAVIDVDGNPVVYDLQQPEDLWRVVDLARYASPDPDNPDASIGDTATDIEVFEASDGRLMAVVTTSESVLAFERDDAGFWHTTDLVGSITGAEAVVGTITVFADRDGRSYVGGVTTTGDVVTYEFDANGNGGEGEWTYTNISQEHLVPKEVVTPVFAGPIVSFVTPWNALNIIGLDADGAIQAVWTGDGGAEWHANNLSVLTGSAPLASGLTAFVTAWNAINIVGFDDGGNVLATWWVPDSVWSLSNLTSLIDGPTLVGSDVTSFVTPWGAMNIVGLNESGDLIAYWWAGTDDTNDGDGDLEEADQNRSGWQVANLTAGLDPTDPRPQQQLQSQTNLTYGGELGILGTDATTGDLVRLFFRVDDNVWAGENLTTDATHF